MKAIVDASGLGTAPSAPSRRTRGPRGVGCWLPLAMLLMARAASADWPQLLGPGRDGVAPRNQQLDDRWPNRLQPTWTHDLGTGYAGPVVAGNAVLAYHRLGDQDVLEALDLATGRRRWKIEFAATYGGGINSDDGPRCTPVVDEGQVFAFSAAGELFCVSLDNGVLQWRRNLYADYRAQEGFFGAGSTPLVWDDRVLINVGGRAADSGIVAVERRHGKTIWTATQENSSYSSPVKAQFDGKPCAVFVTRLSVIGLNPQNGESHFSFRYGNPGPTVNGATPIIFDNQLFVSSSYNVGARLVRLQGDAETIWRNDSLSSQYSTSIYLNGYLYGSHGREDTGQPALRCLDAKTGAVVWSREDIGVAHLIRLGEELLVLEVARGTLRRVAADPAGYRELARAETAGALSRALPALVQGRLLVRSTESDGGKLRSFPVGRARQD